MSEKFWIGKAKYRVSDGETRTDTESFATQKEAEEWASKLLRIRSFDALDSVKIYHRDYPKDVMEVYLDDEWKVRRKEGQNETS